MPFDSNGVFSRVMNWTSDQQNGIAIECGRHDQEDDNFAQGFNDCFCRDGRAAATGDFNLGSHKIKNLANGAASTDAVNKGQLDTGLSVKANTTDVVNLTGTQTITGLKTIEASTGDNRIDCMYIKNPNMTADIVPQETSGKGIVFTDKNDKSLGYLEFFGRQNGDRYIALTLCKNNAPADNIVLGLDTNDNIFTLAPSCDRVGSIVTTTGINKNQNGYVKLGNGIIIQWGWHSGSGSSLTFPTPFTSTNYSVTANYRKQSSSGSGIGHVNFYPTSTTSCYFNSQGGDFQWIAIGY